MAMSPYIGDFTSTWADESSMKSDISAAALGGVEEQGKSSRGKEQIHKAPKDEKARWPHKPSAQGTIL